MPGQQTKIGGERESAACSLLILDSLLVAHCGGRHVSYALPLGKAGYREIFLFQQTLSATHQIGASYTPAFLGLAPLSYPTPFEHNGKICRPIGHSNIGRPYRSTYSAGLQSKAGDRGRGELSAAARM